MFGEIYLTGDQEGSTKKKYVRFQHSTKDLENALEAVRSGQLNLNKASLQFNIPKSDIVYKIARDDNECRRMGPLPVLSFAKEKPLEDWIVGKAKIGFPMHKAEVKDAVYNVMIETRRKKFIYRQASRIKMGDTFSKTTSVDNTTKCRNNFNRQGLPYRR